MTQHGCKSDFVFLYILWKPWSVVTILSKVDVLRGKKKTVAASQLQRVS